MSMSKKKVTREASIFSVAHGRSINQAEVCFYSEYLMICKQFSVLLLKKFNLPVNSTFILASQLVGVWLIETLPQHCYFVFPFHISVCKNKSLEGNGT